MCLLTGRFLLRQRTILQCVSRWVTLTIPQLLDCALLGTTCHSSMSRLKMAVESHVAITEDEDKTQEAGTH